MKSLLSGLILISIMTNQALACDPTARCVPPLEMTKPAQNQNNHLIPMKESLNLGKSGIVCSLLGEQLFFTIGENQVKVGSHSFPINGFIVNPVSGNEELKGQFNDNNFHTIIFSQMETATALIFKIDTDTDYIETSLDSRLCK